MATGIMRIINATRYSFQGFQACFRSEEAFRQEVLLLVIAIPLALWLGDNPLEIGLMIGSILLLMIVELLNSGIEETVDRISMEQHPMSKRAKDMGSAAVFLTIVNALLIWLCMLL